MADNTTLDSGSSGNTIRTLEDGSSIHWPVGVVAYATSVGTPDVLSIPTAAALADDTSNPTTLLQGSCILVYDGTTWDRARGDATDGLLVNLGGNNDITGTVTANLGATDNAVLDSIVTNTTGLAGTVSGSELQVDVVASLPAGTNAIGKLAANSGVDIGDVDVISVTPGTGASNLGKQEDSAHTSGDVGVMGLAVRNDTLSARATTDGDYAPLQVDASGALYVQQGSALDVSAATVTVANGGTFAVQVDSALPAGTNAIGKLAANSGVDIGDVDVISVTPGTGASNLGKAEDAAHSSGDVGVMGLAVRNDTLAALATTDGDYAPLQVNATGAIYVQEGSALDVSAATVTVANGGTFAVQVDAALPSGTNAIGKLAANSGVDIGDVTINNASLAVTSASALDVSGATVMVDLGANNDVVASGDVAHDSADSGNPVKLGAVALAHGASPTAVAASDRTQLYANRDGILWTIAGHPNIVTKEFAFTTAQTNQALVSVSSGTKIAVTNVAAIVDNATSVDVGVRIGFATATLSAASTSGVAGLVLSHPGIAAGSGYNRGGGSSVLGVGADGEDLRLTSEAATDGSLRILVSYFEIES